MPIMSKTICQTCIISCRKLEAQTQYGRMSRRGPIRIFRLPFDYAPASGRAWCSRIISFSKFCSYIYTASDTGPQINYYTIQES